MLLSMLLVLTACGAAFASGEASSPEEQAAETTVSAEEHAVPLEGVSNARQLGGYVTEDGRTVRENVLLRSGELAGATEEDIKTLSEVYHVTTIVDFRNAEEIEETPDPEISGAKNIHIALRDESMGAALKNLMGSGEQDNPELAFIERIRSGWNPLNENMYVDLIKTDAAAAGLREFLDLLLEQEEGTAILWHCSGGKDRTSVAAAAILTLLGVDEETILDEFELTNELTADEIDAKVETSSQYTDDENELYLVRATASAQRDFMALAFDYAEEQSGSMLDFIRERCQVTDEEIERLQEKYLTDASAPADGDGETFVTADMAARAEAQALPLEGVSNAWQLGGYVTEDGRTVRENALLRTGTLSDATEEDVKTLSETYHLTTIVDFRSPTETSQTPDPEVPGAEYISISLEDKDKQENAVASLAEMASVEMEFSDEPGRAMIEMIRLGWRTPNPDMYIDMITSEATDVGFRAFLDVLLAQDEDSVVLYHCRSGKDRTGTATMLLLTILGVDEETILSDFELTNYFLADVINAEAEQSSNYTDDEEELEMVRVNAGVSRDFMARAFDFAEEQCGSMLEYIKQEYNVTDEEIEYLRDIFLVD